MERTMELVDTDEAKFWRRNTRLVCLTETDVDGVCALFVPHNGVVLVRGPEDQLRAYADKCCWAVNDNLMRGRAQDPSWTEREGAQGGYKEDRVRRMPSEKVIEEHWASSPGYQKRIREAKKRRS